MDFLGDVEGALEKFVEVTAGGAGFLGGLVSFFDLAEDFGFAEDHGVEAGDDAVEMLHAALGSVAEERFGGLAGVGGDEAGEGGEGILSSLGGGVEFDAVAGGDDDDFGDAGLLRELDSGGGDGLFGDGELFPDVDGCGVMTEAEADDLHLVTQRFDR